MRRLIAAIGFTACALSLHAGEINWEADYGAALAKARETGKHVMLMFTKAKNPASEQLRINTFSDPAVKTALQSFYAAEIAPGNVVVEILAHRFAVDNVPSIIFLDKYEGVLASTVGYVPPADFIGVVKQAEAAAAEFVKKAVEFEKNPTAQSAADIVELYLKRKQTEMVAKLIPQARELISLDEKMSKPEHSTLRARLYIAEAFSILRNTEEPGPVFELLAKAEKEAAEFDKETAARAVLLRGVLNLEVDRIEDGAEALEQLVKKYPDTKWAPAAKKYAEEARAEIERRKAAEKPPENPEPAP